MIRMSQDVNPGLIHVANIKKIQITGRQQLATFVTQSFDFAVLSHSRSRRGAVEDFQEIRLMDAYLMLPFAGVKAEFGQIAIVIEPQS